MVADFEKVKYGFWKQINPKPFVYDEEYENKQSTNEAMSYLRLGWMMGFFRHECLKNMNIVDIGCGNGIFIDTVKRHFGRACKYDVCGDSIGRDELYDTEWDMVFLTDVLEHFDKIDELFKIRWKNAFISFPETPDVEYVELVKWRHFKPDEHIWCFNLTGICQWLEDNNCVITATSHIEDLVRKRWNESKPNISTVLVNRF